MDFIYGIRTVIEAIKNGKEIDKVLIKKGLQGELFQELAALIKKLDIPCQYVPIQKIEKVTRKNHQGVVAFVSAIEYGNIENIIPDLYDHGKNPFILILDGITDIRNFGAIVRTAECANVHAIVVPHKGSAQINADAIKTSSGALHIVPVCRSKSLRNTIEFLKNSGLQIVSASEKGDSTMQQQALEYHEIDYNKPTAIILGAEDTGVSKDCLKKSDFIAKIPVRGTISSLNVSVAAGVLIYEAIKQRG
jgi:23S rRNA (guanosine2251-2'-O)-methyltransferase